MSIGSLEGEIIGCSRCPRLVAHREKVAREKRRAYRDWTYWGKPVPGFGDPRAKLLIVGLAPAAHGANRTGRMFTGDRSGDWLYRALHRAGLATRAESTDLDDALELEGCFITATCRCAPPDNKPTRDEILNCRDYLDREFQLLKQVRAILGLGKIGFDAGLALIERHGGEISRPRPKFSHRAQAVIERDGGTPIHLLGSYHPSQQNTQTGRLTEAMLDGAITDARNAASLRGKR